MYNPIPSSLQSSMANKVRRMPAGLTPPLKYLMAMQDVAEAQRQLGIARDAMQPKNMPTVMAQLQQQVDPQDAPQNDMPGRAEMLAKAQGLGALNQGQRIPGAPQGQPPQGAPQMAQAQGPQPMQRMAAGGLARIQSNLPQEYAGGGIIAFGEKDGDQKVPEVGSTMSYGEQIGKTFSGIGSMAASLASLSIDGLKAIVNAPDSPEQKEAAKLALEQKQQEEYGKELAARTASTPQFVSGTPAPVAAPAEQGLAAAAKAKADAANIPPTAPPAFKLPAKTAAVVSPMQQDFEKNARANMAIDPKAAGKTDSEEYAARYAAQLGAEQAALRATQRQDYELGKTANQEWEAKATPTWADKAIAWGDSAAFGQWGKGGQKMQEQEALFQENKLKRGQGLAALKRVADEGNLADKTKAFEGTEAARSAGRTSAVAQKKDAMDDVGRILATQGTNAATITAAEIQAAAHVYGAKLSAHAQENASKRADITGLKGEIAAGEAVLKRNSPMAVMQMEPTERLAAIAENGRAHAVMEANRERLAQLTQTKYTPVAASEAPGLTPEQTAKFNKMMGK